MKITASTITDWILFGGIFSIPILLAQTDCSFRILTSFFCLPLHFVSAVSAFFTILWFVDDCGWKNVKETTRQHRFRSIAEGMIIPVLFFCGLLMLFSEPVSVIILYGSASYLISIPVLFMRTAVQTA